MPNSDDAVDQRISEDAVDQRLTSVGTSPLSLPRHALGTFAAISDQALPLEPRLKNADAPVWLPGDRPPVARARLRADGLWVSARAASDVISLLAAAALSAMADPEHFSPGLSTLAILVTLLAFASAGLYTPRLRLQLRDELRGVLAASALVTLSITGIVLATGLRTGVGDAAVAQWLVAATMLCGGRVALFGGQRAARRRLTAGSRTLIIGAGQVGHLAAKRLLDTPALGLRPVGFLDKEPLLDERERILKGLPEMPLLGASWDLEQVVATHGIDYVVVAFSTAPHEVMLNIVRTCWKLGVGVLVVPRLYEVEGRRMHVEHLGALPLVALHSLDPRGWQFAVKYGIDRAAAMLALIGLAPLLALIALAVRITMGGPVLFRQQRVGRDGHLFEMLKFRTMTGAPDRAGEADAEWATLILAGTGLDGAAGHAQRSEDRRTPLGNVLRKLSLDELPQLWNVLCGDMSLVGPRPERLHYVQRFEEAINRYPDRHRVKSGLTGWAQVNGLRGETSLVDRVEWDNFYIENWSPWLDLKIMLKTLPAMLGRRAS
jgi:exopolysaccharide biosynthesis polyprenyl glycosylphosphotransferase